MSTPTYNDRERKVLANPHSLEYRLRAGPGGSPIKSRRPLNGESPSEVWHQTVDALTMPQFKNKGVAVYAVADIDGEECYCAVSLQHNPWAIADAS
jgi:hypothetical protein